MKTGDGSPKDFKNPVLLGLPQHPKNTPTHESLKLPGLRTLQCAAPPALWVPLPASAQPPGCSFAHHLVRENGHLRCSFAHHYTKHQQVIVNTIVVQQQTRSVILVAIFNINIPSFCRKNTNLNGPKGLTFKIQKRDILVGLSPFPVIVANEGL